MPFAIDAAEILYDLSMLEEMDDTDYLRELLTILLMEMPKDLKEMKEALTAGRIEIVCKKAHKLKSSAGVIQAKKITILLENIETIGKKGVTGKDLSFLVENAAQEYNCIEKGLKIYMEDLK